MLNTQLPSYVACPRLVEIVTQPLWSRIAADESHPSCKGQFPFKTYNHEYRQGNLQASLHTFMMTGDAMFAILHNNCVLNLRHILHAQFNASQEHSIFITLSGTRALLSLQKNPCHPVPRTVLFKVLRFGHLQSVKKIASPW